MKDLLKQWGKHVVALILFLGLVMTYFSPAVFDGKVIMQGDNIKATGMGSSQMDQYAETAQPGEFSVWSDAMFGGMPYVTGYGQAAPSMPSYSIVDGWLKKVGYGDAAMVFTVKVVASLDEAMAHIAKYSTKHSECIITRDLDAAQKFQRTVDAAVVYVNASTRFTDGGEFGYGAEIGISTQKLHARGPMGLHELTTVKYLVTGSGQIRE